MMHPSRLALLAAPLFLAACGATETSASESSSTAAEQTETAMTEAATAETDDAPSADSVYALSAETLAGEPVALSKYEGKVTVFVNVASKCGYTPQYKGLQALHEELGGEGFAIVGVPSNDFGGQEPGTASEIQEFCQANYGVTFDMLSKQGTKEGDSPLFDRFAELTGNRPGWNFCKFVVSRDGRTARFFKSSVAPDSPELAEAIQQLGS